MRATKDSGVDWLGEVPANWQTSPLRTLMSLRNERNTAYRSDNYLSLMANVGVIPYAEKGDVGNKAPEDLGKCKIVSEGDFVLNSMNFGIGSFGVSAYDGICSSVYVVMAPRLEKVVPSFLRYIFSMQPFQKHVQSLGNGILEHRAAIGWDELKNIGFPIPDLDEQRRIADFLDRETAKIDALIAKQQQLITTLDERKQAAVSQVLSLGLRNEVSMKESGVKWLGEVPSHWDVVPIKWLTSVRRGSSPRPIDDPKYFDENGEWAWVRISDVTASKGLLRQTRETLSELGSSLSTKILPGELFVSIAGTVGMPAIADIKCCIHDGFVYFPTLTLNRKYLYRILESGRCFGGLGKLGTQLNLNTDTIGNIRVPIPPPRELDEIVEFIDAEVEKANALVARVQTAVALLLERRQALISAAVTGKLEVGV